MIGTGGSHRALALVLAWASITLGLLSWSAPRAAAAGDVQLTFTMTSLTVSGYRPDDTVTLLGSVTNTGPVDAYGVQVILWRSRDAIENLATLRLATTNNTLGSRLAISPEHYVALTTSTAAFPPGESRQVTLSATIGELGFDTPGAAFSFGADVIANSAPGTEYRTAGQLRTFIPIPGAKKVPVTSIVLLSATPTKLADGLFRNDDLALELTGRLSILLDAAALPDVSWLIDPALLDEVRDLADGYQVQTSQGNQPGSGSAAAQAWLARFDKLDDDAGARTLFASPDLEGARLAGDDQVVKRAERAASKVAGVKDLPVIALPGQATLTADTYAWPSASGVDLVAAKNLTRAGALQSASKPKILAVSASVPGDPAQAQNLRRQYALATAAIAGARGEVRILSTASDVAQDTDAMGGWLVRRGLDDLLDTSPSVARATLVATVPAHLSESQFAAAARLEKDFATHAELDPNSTLTKQSDAAVSRSIASAWIDDSRGLSDYRRGVSRLVNIDELGRQVILGASPRFVMSSRANQFPITVTNNLTEEIQVKVVVTSQNPQRLTVPPSDLVLIEPGQSVTVNVRPEATANGMVAATAHVATASGRRVTADTPLTIEVTELGVVAWIIVAASALVLIGATAWRIRQVRRRDAGPKRSAEERTAR